MTVFITKTRYSVEMIAVYSEKRIETLEHILWTK
jgi:hypothetical protein